MRHRGELTGDTWLHDVYYWSRTSLINPVVSLLVVAGYLLSRIPLYVYLLLPAIFIAWHFAGKYW